MFLIEKIIIKDRSKNSHGGSEYEMLSVDRQLLQQIHHQNTNDHHWEYWMPRTKHDQDKDTSSVLPMSEGAVLEMISDWLGASKPPAGG